MSEAAESDRGELVSIIIPCRNELKYIESCVHSVLDFDLPKDVAVEILVMDGSSTDGTREKLIGLSERNPEVTMLENPGMIQSTAVNLGVKAARGQWIMRLDAHAVYPNNYLRLCYETAIRSKADNSGGIFITEAGGEGYSAQVVQALTTHKFGVGDSGFRTGAKEGWADTVPYGFFKRDLFNRIGWLDERLVRAQDYEFNRRIVASGGRILRNPAIQIRYFNQPTLAAFYKKQFFREAPYNAYLWYIAPYAFSIRHAITGVFASGVILGLFLAMRFSWAAWCFGAVMILYGCMAILSGFQQAIRYRRIIHAIVLPECFFLFHFIHGLGVLVGLVRLATRTAPVQRAREPWPNAGRMRAWPLPER